jgi:predicted RNA-binding Zn-ribbon protein involved in translation (DUF1610 family)
VSGLEQVHAECDWCGTEIHVGNAQVVIARNVEQVNPGSAMDSRPTIQVIESNVLLTLCPQCGNRLDREQLASFLRT